MEMSRLACAMRALVLLTLPCLWTAAACQSKISDQELLAKSRAAYDAPFTRNLISFDCAVEFDWKKHFVDLLGSMPPAALPTTERLQAVPHRVFVDRSGATVCAQPKAPDLAGVAHGAELEQVYNSMISSGLNAWLPSSTNVLLPVGPTKFNFEPIASGYKLTMSGKGLDAQLLLTSDLRLRSGVTQLPQPTRFTTDFDSGPEGFVLTLIRTGNTTDTAVDSQATFAYTYQTAMGFQLPAQITVTSAQHDKWIYRLTDCKTMTGRTIRNLPVAQ